MNDIVENSLLYDFYGELLTEKKRQVLEMYHDDDMSLSEIAGVTGVSRAAVYDSLKAAEKQMAGYERKLGLVRQYLRREEETASMISDIENIEKLVRETEGGENRDTVLNGLNGLKEKVSRLSGE
ncbi:MAG: YlxM family DNA-binding protein [Eubacteriales bacterium]|nr:YlxM family DNA-binding protein [Eubacteriales bacterium]